MEFPYYCLYIIIFFINFKGNPLSTGNIYYWRDVSMKKIYLDNCSFNRPYDSQNHLLVKIETIAKFNIQDAIRNREYILVWSFILDYENSFNTPDKAENILKWRDIALTNVKYNDIIFLIAKEIMLKGISEADALHLASAIYAETDYFITVDKKLLKYKDKRIMIINPINFIERVK